MRVTPIDANIDLAASDLVRSPGLHMSQIYGALYAELEPERYGDRGDGGPDRTRLGMGFVLEDVLEDAFKRRVTNLAGEEAIRPGEFRTAEGVAFSPDYLIMNGGVRLGESKLTWMSCGDMPTEEATGLPERFSKWVCVAPDTPIMRSDLSYVSAEDVHKGDVLMGFDEHVPDGESKRRFKATRVRRVKTLTKPCVEITLADGATFICSTDHQWLAASSAGQGVEWTPSTLLLRADRRSKEGQPRVSNSFLCRVMPGAAQKPVLSGYDMGYLAGFADGEGCLLWTGGRYLRLLLSQNEGPVLFRVENLLRKGGFKYVKRHATVGGSFGDKCYSLHVGHVADIIRFLAVMRPTRLLQKFERSDLRQSFSYDKVAVVSRRAIGDHPVVAIETDTHTYVADGYASHNCQMQAYCEALETNHARLIACFVNGGYEHQRKGARRGQPPTPKLLAYDIEFTARELKTNRDALVNYARSKGWL